ncbi:hypothetical protein REPUB_Repub05bG0148700 [Reevesia pubescens]
MKSTFVLEKATRTFGSATYSCTLLMLRVRDLRWLETWPNQGTVDPLTNLKYDKMLYAQVELSKQWGIPILKSDGLNQSQDELSLNQGSIDYDGLGPLTWWEEAEMIMYKPLRDLNGIPGAKSLIICLTGYQRQDRDDIMTMVSLMGAQFSKPLVANKVTHLICYKFEDRTTSDLKSTNLRLKYTVNQVITIFKLI